jgi:DNA-binding MarR family transcriptional regulator
MKIFQQTSSTRENIGLLAVMEALEGGGQITQRELAQQTGLNLKKVNFCLHKLLERGFVKFQRVRQNRDKRAYLYVLTPSGIKAKTLLTYDFLKFTMNFYTQGEDKLRKCLRDLKVAEVKRVLLYGMSDIVRIFIGLIKDSEIEIVGIVDASCVGQNFQEVPIISQDEILGQEWDGLLITALDGLDVIEQELYDLSIPQNVIWCVS